MGDDLDEIERKLREAIAADEDRVQYQYCTGWAIDHGPALVAQVRRHFDALREVLDLADRLLDEYRARPHIPSHCREVDRVIELREQLGIPRPTSSSAGSPSGSSGSPSGCR